MQNVIKFFSYIGATILTAMMLFTVIDVLLRYTLNRPIYGSTEISQSMLIVFAFIAIVYCAAKEGNVAMDCLTLHLSSRKQALLQTIGSGCSLAVVIPMTCLLFPEALQNREDGVASFVLGIPAYPFFFIMFACCLLLSVILLITLARSLRQTVKS